MVVVKQPFFSGYASGSIGKTLTCRAMFNNKFCMHRFRLTQNKRSPAQIWAQERFKRKIELTQNFYSVSDHRSARLNFNYLGLTILGATEGISIYLNKFPPLKIQR